ncbi:unnamed protein product [Allacma fusca]|uniref:Peptidase aspartic putative domain-containing protein n=1 Tax=Allacma fusca TaxID=39272 RepID=A0A8J2JNR1_9HEXA|nr:unnamed protein product [Allacma fusca]
MQAALPGGSGRVIESLSITDTNYIPAWDAVKAKYHHEREIVFNHLDRILDQACVTQGSLVALEKLKSDCNNSFTALKALKREHSLGEDFIVKIMMRKLDAETRKEFKKYLPDREVPSLKSLNEFIDKVVADHATESSEFQATVPSHRQYDSKTSSKPTRPVARKCSFCQGEHYNYSCKKLLDKPVGERLTFVKETKVCTNCLSPTHATKDCHSKKLCKKCSKNHHTLLHKDIPDSFNKPKVQANTAQTANSSQNILATAMVQVKNKYGQDWECRALIDNGSTHTFINSSLVTLWVDSINLKIG